jgi:hypothetical protein
VIDLPCQRAKVLEKPLFDRRLCPISPSLYPKHVMKGVRQFTIPSTRRHRHKGVGQAEVTFLRLKSVRRRNHPVKALDIILRLFLLSDPARSAAVLLVALFLPNHLDLHLIQLSASHWKVDHGVAILRHCRGIFLVRHRLIIYEALHLGAL